MKVATDRGALRSRWVALGTRIGCPTSELLEPLLADYAHPDRHYHNLQHIADCLSDLDGVRELARQPDTVELAIGYHDVVYDTHAIDNEARPNANLTEIRAVARVR